MSKRNPELLADVLKRVFVPHPETWDQVAIPDDPPANSQLDLFVDSACNQTAVETQSGQRLR